MNISVAMQKEWREQARTRKLLALWVVLIAFGMLSPLLAKLTPQMMTLIPGGEQFAGMIPEPTAADAVAQFIKNTNQFAVLLALLLSMGSIVNEKERGTAAMLLTKPLPRPAFVLAKFVVLAGAFLVGIGLAGLGAYYYTSFLFGPTSLAAWLGAVVLLWLQCLVFIALTLFFSVLVRSAPAAAGLGFGVIILFSILDLFRGLAQHLPNQLLIWAGSLFSEQQPSWGAALVSAAIVLAALAGAILIFQRQEL